MCRTGRHTIGYRHDDRPCRIAHLGCDARLILWRIVPRGWRIDHRRRRRVVLGLLRGYHTTDDRCGAEPEDRRGGRTTVVVVVMMPVPVSVPLAVPRAMIARVGVCRGSSQQAGR